MATKEARDRAIAKWREENNVQRVAFNLYPSRGDPTVEQLKAAAARDGMSLNSWLIEAAKDKL